MLIDFSKFHPRIENHDIDQQKGLMSHHRKKPSNTQGSTRSRQRRRIRHHYCCGSCCRRIRVDCLCLNLLVFLSLWLLPEATKVSSATKWLQHRLRQIAAAHLDTPTTPPLGVEPPPPITPSSSSSSSSLHSSEAASNPLLVVATHEGQVWTIDSTDGTVKAGFSTGPPLLVVDDYYEDAGSSSSNRGHGASHHSPPTVPTSGLTQSQIVPSMDGILYWRQPILPTTTTTTQQQDNNQNDNNDSQNSNTKLVPIASIRDLVDNPIQICQEADGKNCDILTATSLGPSLFSLNSQGSLNWARARSSTTSTATSVKPVPMQRANSDTDSSRSGETTDDNDDDTSSEGDTDSDNNDNNDSGFKSSLLLQRQDYLVQQISTETGEQVWNITWGSLEALDFLGPSDDAAAAGGTGKRPCRGDSSRCQPQQQHIHYLPSGDKTIPSALPSLIFANQGKSLVALLTQPPKFLWKQDFISVVTNVLGIERDSWRSVHVLPENNSMDDDDDERAHSPHYRSQQHRYPRIAARSETQSLQEEDMDRWYWFWAGGSSGLGKKSKALDIEEQYFIQPQEENGLIFIPRPNAHDLVRNSWYLNHLWDSPQARGAQSFKGFIADRPHNDADEEKDYRQGHSVHRNRPRPLAIGPPPRKLDEMFDTSSMPRLLLLPPSEHPNLRLPSPANSGGVFLSWSVVVAIITVLVGTAGAAYIIYGQKKRKWMANSSSSNGNAADHQESTGSSSSQGMADLTGATSSVSPYTKRERSVSTGHDISRSQQSHESVLNGSDSNLGSRFPVSTRLALKNLPRHVLNRSSSAPLITGDHIDLFGGSDGSLLSSTIHSREISPNRRASAPLEKKEEPAITPGSLVKHQSAPIDMPVAPQGGVGMIDGIPLIRYSRYQSEFRELEPLGRGGFGTVFRVANVLDGREYAVKKVSIRSSDWNSPGTEAFSQELHRVLREVKFLALLDHPNIVRYYTAWLEMEDHEHEVDENTNSKTLSRRYSSELLTGLDPTFGGTGESQTQSHLGKPNSASISVRTPSHLKSRNGTNPLGWNNDFSNLDESSASAYYPKHTMPVIPSMEDCGFIFEEEGSNDGEDAHEPAFKGPSATSYRGHSGASSDYSKSESHSVSSSWDASYSLNRRNKRNNMPPSEAQVEEKKATSEGGEQRNNNKSASRHTLYIQMQLCSPKTLGDFLADKEARQGPAAGSKDSPGSNSVDIPCALRLFLQIVQAVQHVHAQNLIHRDLKPSNCFIDDTGTVKVGDFGLSRESNDCNDYSENASIILDGDQDTYCADNTVGVGTRSYASPEQMNGSDYDSKTDIYSLGVMLFELLYPMYTGMERHICFQKLRTACTFPEMWHSTVAVPFPTLNELVRSMLSLTPKDRPTADKVARHIQGLLEEHSVTLSISHHDGDTEHVIFVRVEAKPVPDILKSTIQFIHDAAAPLVVDILQYGMRSSTKKSHPSKPSEEELPQRRAILEFAIASADVEPVKLASWGSSLVRKLEEYDEILVARHVWHQTTQSSYWSSRSSLP